MMSESSSCDSSKICWPQGNSIAQLPSHLINMSYGTLSLIYSIFWTWHHTSNTAILLVMQCNLNLVISINSFNLNLPSECCWSAQHMFCPISLPEPYKKGIHRLKTHVVMVTFLLLGLSKPSRVVRYQPQQLIENGPIASLFYIPDSPRAVRIKEFSAYREILKNANGYSPTRMYTGQLSPARSYFRFIYLKLYD